MSLKLERYRMRFACDALSHDPMACLIQKRAPITWRGIDLQIEVALRLDGVLTDDISNISKILLDVHDNAARAAGPIMPTKEVSGAGINATLTAEQWATGAADKAHAVFTFTRAETNFDMTGAADAKKKFWIVVHAVTTAGYYTTYGGTVWEVEEDGAQLGLAVLTPAAYSFQIQNSDDPDYVHTVRVRGTPDNPSFELSPGVHL